MKQNKIVVAVLAIIAIAAVFMIMNKNGTGSSEVTSIVGDPKEVVNDFYGDWMSMHLDATATSTDGLIETAPLTDTFRRILANADTSDTDRVVCAAYDRARVRVTELAKATTTAQFLVAVPDATIYALVDLIGDDGTWRIDNITCTQGDVAPEQGEFSFDNEGFLLKQVPAPFNPEFWHLVWDKGGDLPGVAQLNFNEASVCIALDGSTSACDESFLYETAKAHIYGQMTETGVEVVRVEYVAE